MEPKQISSAGSRKSAAANFCALVKTARKIPYRFYIGYFCGQLFYRPYGLPGARASPPSRARRGHRSACRDTPGRPLARVWAPQPVLLKAGLPISHAKSILFPKSGCMAAAFPAKGLPFCPPLSQTAKVSHAVVVAFQRRAAKGLWHPFRNPGHRLDR